MAQGTSSETGRPRLAPRRRAVYIRGMAKRTDKAKLPAVTIVIEWENAIDVEDKWTSAAMVALERELAAVAPKMAEKPRITYL